MKTLVVCLNPTFQHTLVFSSFSLGEVNRAQQHYLDASGKGMNAARILTQLGHKAILLTHLGGERKGEMLMLCEKDGVEVRWADSHSDIRTCTTILCQGQATELVEEPHPVDASVEPVIRTLFTQALDEVDALIITGTRAPGYAPSLYADFVREAKEKNLFVLLDLKGDDLKACLPFRPDVIKPNLSEAVQTFLGLSVGEQEETEHLQATIRFKLEEIHRTYGTVTFLSRGKQEMWVQGPSFFTVPIERVEIANTIGCGDSLGAALTASLYTSTNMQHAAKYATKIATMNAKTIHPGSIV
ncbi:Tagatose-6-phosphate kinase [bioreactor metagenome]|uniref:Tagatose-6-phosphate kinase n=1 Tax=bioreactor metagenome TaxID=1076179 RepID=A0A645AFI3_9ZZZZ|nr:PfkB family carbohydrate kinase [Sphaerochaeta sp.]